MNKPIKEDKESEIEEIVVDMKEIKCYKCGTILKIPIPVWGQRRIDILQKRLERLIAEEDRVKEEIDYVLKMIEKS